MSFMSDYQTVQSVLDENYEQRQSVDSKNAPYRVEFRYRHGTKHWKYYATVEDARQGEDRRAGYGFSGRAYVERPISRQIQVKGPRGGWSAMKVNQ